MKTIRTVNGVKKNRRAGSLVPVQLRSILKEHRMTLVDKNTFSGQQSKRRFLSPNTFKEASQFSLH